MNKRQIKVLLSFDKLTREEVEEMLKYAVENNLLKPSYKIEKEIFDFFKTTDEMVEISKIEYVLCGGDEPVCSPFDLEEKIKSLEKKGEIYYPRHGFIKATITAQKKYCSREE